MSQNKSNGTSAPASNTSERTLDSDIALLTSLLSQDTADAELDDEADVAELLRRLEAAHGIADGMENRLDGLIQNLDSLLDTLGPDARGEVVVKEEINVDIEVRETVVAPNSGTASRPKESQT